MDDNILANSRKYDVSSHSADMVRQKGVCREAKTGKGEEL
jgi:hypothetical protein